MSQRITDLSITAVANALGLRTEGKQTTSGEHLFCCANPQHADEHPSMRINEERGVFCCDVCGDEASGGILDLVALKLGLDLSSSVEKREVVAWLVREAGLQPKPSARRSDDVNSVDRWRESKSPARAPLSQLQSNLFADEPALAVLHSRKISDDAIRALSLGLVVSKTRFTRDDGETVGHEATLCFVIPMLDAKGKQIGRRHRARVGVGWPLDKRGASEKSVTLSRSKMGLLLPSVWREGAETWIAEGEMDLLALLTQRGGEVNCIGTPGTGLSPGQIVMLTALLDGVESVVVAMQNDERKRSDKKTPAESWALKIVSALGADRCRVWRAGEWQGGEKYEDLCAAHEDGVGLEQGEIETAEEFLSRLKQLGAADKAEVMVTKSGAIGTVESPLSAIEDRGMVLASARGDVIVSNWSLHISRTALRISPHSNTPESEVVCVITPLTGLDRRPREIVATQAEWLDCGRMLERIHSVFPMAWERLMTASLWQEFRCFAMRGDVESVEIIERVGWHEGRLLMPEVEIGDGEVVSSSSRSATRPSSSKSSRVVVLPQGLSLGWLPPEETDVGLLTVLRDLLALSTERHLNGGLMGIHLVAALRSLLRKRESGVVCPWVLVDGPSEIGKSFLCRAHAMVHGNVNPLEGGGCTFSVKGCSPKSVEVALAHLDGVVVLIDDLNPNSLSQQAGQDWMRFFHAVYDSAGARRLTRDRRMTITASTGATLILTAEDRPSDPASANRFLSLSMMKPTESMQELTRCQTRQRTLRTLVPVLFRDGFELYGNGFDGLCQRFEEIHRENLGVFGGGDGRRFSAMGAALFASLRLTAEILTLRTAVKVGDGSHLGLRHRFNVLEEGLRLYLDMAAGNGAVHHENRCDIAFCDAVAAMIDAGEIWIHGLSQDGEGPAIGWFHMSTDSVCLLTPTIFSKVYQFCQRQGRPLRFSVHAIRTHLLHAGHFKGPSKDGKSAKTWNPNAQRTRSCLHFKPECFGFSLGDAEGAESEPDLLQGVE
jgi:hypothetical protein